MADLRKPTVTKGWQKKDRDVAVARIWVTAHNQPNIANSAGKTLLHWRVNGAYELDGSNRSVAYDTRKESPSEPIIETTIDSKTFAYSSQSKYKIELEMAETETPTTTTDIANYLISGKFGAYKYDGNGSGCLFWCRSLIRQLEQDGLIKQGSLAILDAEIAAAKQEDKFWIPDDQGEFF